MRDAGTVSSRVGLAAVITVLGLPAVSAQTFFPRPFVVEHHVVQTGTDGDVYVTEAVTDYYDGSRIISVRPDGSRLVLDFARRELTEVRPGRGTWSVLSFDRFAELRGRLRYLEKGDFGPHPGKAATLEADRREAEEPEFDFEELSGRTKAAGAEPGVRRLRVRQQSESGGREGPAVEVWLDPKVRLGPAALAALERFEDEVLGSRETGEVAFSRYISAARKHAGGAFPVRTVRPLPGEGAVEDRALRLEPVAAVPREILNVPESYRRVPHPLEQMVAYAEEEAALVRKMGQPIQETEN